jgi:Uma2 family endonuclease
MTAGQSIEARDPMSAATEYPKRHLVTAEEYFRMGEVGVFEPDARLELIEGEIFEMAPIHSPHAGRVNKLNRLFVQRAGGEEAALYGRCGIPEAWGVDVDGGAVHVFREPCAEGYRSVVTLRGEARLECAALPRVWIEVGELFPREG